MLDIDLFRLNAQLAVIVVKEKEERYWIKSHMIGFVLQQEYDKGPHTDNTMKFFGGSFPCCIKI